MRSSTSSSSSGGVTRYTPVEVAVPAGAGAAKLEVAIPHRGEVRPSNPQQLMAHVNSAWDSIVERNQAGLVDAKHTGPMAPLSDREAWHHFSASEAGVVDSGRFLITFGMIPSVQSGGSPLHIAASLGDLKRIKALLEEDGSDVNVAKGDGTTPLHAATTMGHTKCRQLVEPKMVKVQ